MDVGGNSRLKDLLEKLGLANRMIENSEEYKEDTIDFSVVEKKLHELRTNSIKFLQDNLCY